jgi:hypothetical protein
MLKNNRILSDVIEYLFNEYDDQFIFLILAVSLLLNTTVVNILYLRSAISTFRHIFLALGIFIVAYISLKFINKMLAKIEALNQNYLLLCNIAILFAIYFFSFFGVLAEKEDISIPVNFWFYNGCVLVCVILLLRFIFSVKSLLCYFVLFNTYFCISTTIFSFLVKIHANPRIIVSLLFFPTIILLFVSKTIPFINAMNTEQSFFPKQNKASSFRHYIAIFGLLIVNISLLLLFALVKHNISIGYTYLAGRGKEINSGSIVIPHEWNWAVLAVHLLYLAPFSKHFINNIRHIRKIKKKIATYPGIKKPF